jgi:IclR family KDG regulon transcriptional repressor
MAKPTLAIVDPVAAPTPAFTYRVQVLDRTLRILDVLAERNTEMGPAELAERLSLHKSTIHRLLVVLERHGLIRKNPNAGKYGLGMKLFELGSRAVAQLDLRERAEPYLRQLVLDTGETAHVCVLEGAEMLSVANAEGPRTLRTPATVGRRTPVHCTSVGKALAAHLPERTLDELLSRVRLTRYTDRTITTRSGLKAELQRIRERGYAVDNEEIEEGLRCVGAPIRNYTGRVVAAMSIAGPVFRVTTERLPALARAVVTTARALSRDLGFKLEKPKS